jgi:AraC-like DNA-binding protein
MNTPAHLQITEVRLSPGEEWSLAAGPWRFVRMSRGAAYYLDAARPRALNEGELMILAPGVKAVVRASQLGDVLLHGFNFAPDLLYGFFTLAERHIFETAGASAVEPARFLPSTHPLTRRFAELLARREPGHQLAQRAALLGLALTWFGEGVPRDSVPAPHSTSVHERFQTIIAQMPDAEVTQHTPEQLARLCGCSMRHFNRLFREQFGESPRARQTELRLLKARHLLGETDQRIAQIALDSGYRSLSLFNALFKKRFGLSPSECREKGDHGGTGPA